MILLKNRATKGFTLMEMLIVVSIMVVLTVIALPIYTQQIDEANMSVDEANLRSGKALASALFMQGEDFSEIMYYDVVEGLYVSEKPEPYGKTREHSGMLISAKVNAAGDGVIVQWE